jgi:hypothetical protein
MNDANPIPNGKAAAALVAGAMGIAFLGIFSFFSGIIPAFRTLLVLNAAVGSLSGKAIIPVGLWIIVWLGMDYSWKDKDLDFKKVVTWTRIFLIIGLLGTFPLFYRLLGVV